MRKITYRFTFIIGLLAGIAALLAPGPAVAASAVYRGGVTGQPMTRWLLLGPFANPLDGAQDQTMRARHRSGLFIDRLQSLGGEAAARPRAGAEVPGEGGPLHWKLHEASEEVINLDEAISSIDQVTGYAYAEVKLRRAGRYTLAVGSNNGVRVWVNGAEVLSEPEVGSLKKDAFKIPVELRRGTNRLLLKIEETGGSWLFTCRLLPFDLRDYTADALFAVNTAPGAAPRLVVRQPRLAPLIQGGALRLDDLARPAAQPWQGAWDRATTMTLPLDGTTWGEYLLGLTLALEGGTSKTETLRFSTGKRPSFTLFEGGATSYTIVVGREASESERWAAQQLADALHAVSGATFPIADDAQPLPARAICVGLSSHARTLLGSEAPAQPPAATDERFHYLSRGPALVIWGGSRRGTMYGVFDFLERELGCRWYTSTVRVTPRRARYDFALLAHGEAPAIANRTVDYFDVYAPTMGAPNRVNGQRFVRGEQPGGLDRLWLEHSFEVFIPPAEFFKAHPEWFALRDGKRQAERSQLCLSNPEVLPVFVERFKAFMRANPGYVVYNVAQNDNYNYCQCDQCQALARAEGSEMGPMLAFVNKVAEAVEPEFPNNVVGTFAYQYTRKPPRTLRPRHNVMVCLCSIECDWSHPFDHPNNLTFLNDLHAWSAITDRLIIWDYVVNYSHYWLPHPNLEVIQRNIQLLRAAGVQGILEQAQYQCLGAEFSELRAWLLAKLLWNPDLDLRAATDDFLAGYYGRAGAPLRHYLDLLHANVRSDTYISIWSGADEPLFSADFVRQADALFDEAEAVADDDAIRARVERARLSLRYLKIMQDPAAAQREGEWARFLEVMRREGLERVGEGTLLPELVEYVEHGGDKR